MHSLPGAEVRESASQQGSKQARRHNLGIFCSLLMLFGRSYCAAMDEEQPLCDGSVVRRNGVAIGNGVGLEAVLKLGCLLLAVLSTALGERKNGLEIIP